MNTSFRFECGVCRPPGDRDGHVLLEHGGGYQFADRHLAIERVGVIRAESSDVEVLRSEQAKFFADGDDGDERWALGERRSCRAFEKAEHDANARLVVCPEYLLPARPHDAPLDLWRQRHSRH